MKYFALCVLTKVFLTDLFRYGENESFTAWPWGMGRGHVPNPRKDWARPTNLPRLRSKGGSLRNIVDIQPGCSYQGTYVYLVDRGQIDHEPHFTLLLNDR